MEVDVINADLCVDHYRTIRFTRPGFWVSTVTNVETRLQMEMDATVLDDIAQEEVSVLPIF